MPPASIRPQPSGLALSDRGVALIRRGEYEQAIPPIERALSMVAGSGQLVEAYASYNLAFARLELGRCENVDALLDRSEEIQGPRAEIDGLRSDARTTCG